jgi:transcriptional regulator with XRE-family HTH domain
MLVLAGLKYWREQRGYSVRELAEKSGVAYPAVSILENLKRKPQPKTTWKLAEALGVERADLFTPPPSLAAQEVAQPINDNKTPAITPVVKPARPTRALQTLENRARAKAKRQTAPAPALVSSFWVFEKDQEESEPFRLDTEAQAERLKDRLGGQHQARVYEAASRSEASHQHIQFLIRVTRGHDAW